MIQVLRRAMSTGIQKIQRDIRKSVFDRREYGYMKLKNGMECVLIRDDRVDKASAAMDVGVGSLSDPKDVQGLAHFLEHMLFMGTKKFPQENEYSQFLSNHGGFSNAYTSLEHTNYYFEVGAEDLKPALDRFSQFFVAPLFNEDGTERELNAVNSEHNKNIQNDFWRMYQMEKTLCDPHHAFHGFSTGNLKTLKQIPEEKGKKIRDEVIQFYEQHYCSSLMKLVVYGKEKLEDLGEMVEESFGSVPFRNRTRHHYTGYPLGKEQFQKMIQIKPVKDHRLVEIVWQVDDQIHQDKTKPMNYFTHLFGHEGKGSILSELKKRGYAVSLSASSDYEGLGFEFFRVVVELTEEGLRKVDDVIGVIFDYLKMLKKEGIQPWIYEEVTIGMNASLFQCRKMNNVNFTFREESSPSSYASWVASKMQRYEHSMVLQGSYFMQESLDITVLQRVLDSLSVNTFRCLLVSQSVKGTEKEEWYGTEYTVTDFSPSLLEKWERGPIESQVSLPLKNEFLPENFQVQKGVDQKIPQLVVEEKSSSLWHLKDEVFHVPKGYIQVLLSTPVAYTSAQEAVSCHLLVILIEDYLGEFSYAADCAGLSYSLSPSASGLMLTIKGYNDKMLLFCKELVHKIVHFQVDVAKFPIYKEKLMRKYKDFQKEAAHQHAVHYSAALTQSAIWNNQQRLEALEGLEEKGIISFHKKLFTSFHGEVFIHGNIPIDTAKNIHSVVTKELSMTLDKPSPLTSVIVPPGVHVYKDFTSQDVNSSIEVNFQLGSSLDIATRCFGRLLAQVAEEPFFDQLRTKEQLGYIVNAAYKDRSLSVSVRFLIQSNRTPDYLDQRISHFLSSYLTTAIASMTQDEFLLHKKSLITNLTEAKKNLYQQSNQFADAIRSGHYLFHQHLMDAEFVEKNMDLPSFQAQFQSLLVTLPRCLIVYVPAHGVDCPVFQGNLISEIPSWKSSLELLPLPQK